MGRGWEVRTGLRGQDGGSSSFCQRRPPAPSSPLPPRGREETPLQHLACPPWVLVKTVGCKSQEDACSHPPEASLGTSRGDTEQRCRVTLTTFRPGDDQPGDLPGAPGPSKSWATEQELGKLVGLQGAFQAFDVFHEIHRRVACLSVAARFALDAKGARNWTPGPSPRPTESGPCGRGPVAGVSPMTPTCSQTGNRPLGHLWTWQLPCTSATYSADAMCTYWGCWVGTETPMVKKNRENNAVNRTKVVPLIQGMI